MLSWCDFANMRRHTALASEKNKIAMISSIKNRLERVFVLCLNWRSFLRGLQNNNQKKLDDDFEKDLDDKIQEIREGQNLEENRTFENDQTAEV